MHRWTSLRRYAHFWLVFWLVVAARVEAQDVGVAVALTGVVIDAATQLPVVDAVVSIPAQGRAVLSNDTGQFQINAVPFGMHILRVQRIGYTDWTLLVDVGQRTAPVQVDLQPTAVPLPGMEVTVDGFSDVSGVVVDGGSGRPMPDVLVWLPREELRAISDSSGMFVFARVPTGPSLLRVERAGYGRQYRSFAVHSEASPMLLVLQPDSIALRGIPAVSRRLRRRRNAFLGVVLAFDQDRLNQTDVDDARLVLQNFTFAHVVACQGMSRSHWCVDLNGRPVEARVCIDGVPAPGGIDDLQRLRPHDIFLLEVFGTRGATVRAYTHGHMEDMARSQGSVTPDEPTPQREGVDGLGWAPTRGDVAPAQWSGGRC